MNILRLLLLLPLPLLATQLEPWFSPFLQPDLRVAYEGTYYPAFSGFRSNHLHTGYASLNITPWPDWNAEVELATTYSRRSHKTFFDYGRLTGRYLLLDDTFYDPIALAVGLTLTFASHPATREVGLPHLGQVAAEFHAAIGKETVCCNRTWDWRYWALGGIAFAKDVTPTLCALAFIERNLCDRHHLKAGLRALYGTGDRQLNTTFDGWSPYATRALTAELGYEYVIPWWGSLFIDYRYRFLTDNYPRRASFVRIGLLYPISL